MVDLDVSLSVKYLDAPVVIRKEWRGAYMEYLGEQNIESLAELFGQSLEIECERIIEFE